MSSGLITMLNKQGQSMLEYSLLIMVLVVALIAMAIYFRFSFQGRLRGSADIFGRGEQYEPGVTVCYDETGNIVPCSD